MSRRESMVRPPLVFGPGDLRPATVERLGGKGRSLAVLSALGEPVPPWFTITTLAFEVTLEAAGLRQRVDSRLALWDGRSPAERRATAEEIQSWVRALSVPDEVLAALDLACADWLPGEGALAVRSSAVEEDRRGSSMAGVHATLLGVRGRTALLAAVREVWASAFSFAALGYREARQLPRAGIAVAVVVQSLVAAQASGVIFTADPVTGDPHHLVVNALYGMGEGLVGLGLEADRFRVDKATLDVAPELADKRERLEVAPGDRLRRVEVPAERRRAASLDLDQVRALARAALRVERRFGCPQDLEFALDGEGRLWLLQSRAVTALAELGPAAGERILWDHENWGESYPGVTLPMTYSINRRLDRIGYRALAGIFRIPQKRVVEHGVTFDTFLGYIDGRFFTNRVNRHRLCALIPGFAFSSRALLRLFAVRPDELDPALRTATSPLRRWLVELPALLRLVGSLTRELLRVDRQVDWLLTRADAVHGECEALDFQALSPAELLRVYDQVEVRLVQQWRIPMLNAFFLRLSFVLLKSLCARWCGDATLSNELLRSQEVSATGRPVEDLLDLALWLDRRPELCDAFLAAPPQEVARLVSRDPRFVELAAAVDRYLELYPFKGSVEMKLEEPIWRDHPERLYPVLRGYLAAADRTHLDPELRAAQARRAREEAELRAFAGLRAHRGLLPRSWLFRRLLARVRGLDRHREAVKRMRLRLIGLFRELLQAVGQRFAEEGILKSPQDIFFLGFEEVEDYVRGQALSTDLRGLVRLRQAESAAAAAARPDDRFETFGMVYHGNRFRHRAAEPPALAAGSVLRGTGCSRGRITGIVRLRADPGEAALAPGEILVVERAHTGWLPLFPSISGLLIERGEILSHCATVAREMGIPAIVGIPALTAVLRDGQQITIDGTSGSISLLSPEQGDSLQPVGKEVPR